jgi:Arc/MetJ-type ribon-helix-helix transcriptional regulator
MAAMNISLPASMKSFIEEQAVSEGFATVSEYVRAVIREVQNRAVVEIADVLRRFPDGPGHGAETGTSSDAPPDPPGAGED